MLPPDQRLGCDDPPGLHRDLRLEVNLQRLGLQGGSEVAQQGQANGVVLLEIVAEHGRPDVATLGLVHRDVGATNECSRVVTVVG